MRPQTVKQARLRLTELADALAKNNFGWPAVAIHAYLTGIVGSLDEAFGTEQPASPGRKRDKAATRRAREIFKRRLKGQSWAKIADELGGDERQLRRLHADRLIDLMSDEINRQLKKDARR
jgi:hypothetical protein